MHTLTQGLRRYGAGRLGRQLAICLTLAAILVALQVSAAHAGVVAIAKTAGFGAAFGYAQTIGGVAFSQAGSIGNGLGVGVAVTTVSGSLAAVQSGGPAAAFAQAIGSPFGQASFVQVTSFPGGFAFGFGSAY